MSRFHQSIRHNVHHCKGFKYFINYIMSSKDFQNLDDLDLQPSDVAALKPGMMLWWSLQEYFQKSLSVIWKHRHIWTLSRNPASFKVARSFWKCASVLQTKDDGDIPTCFRVQLNSLNLWRCGAALVPVEWEACTSGEALWMMKDRSRF